MTRTPVECRKRRSAIPHFICTTCGTQYAESNRPPRRCAICTDERQYVGLGGQQWTTLDQLRQTHWTTMRQKAPGLIGLGIEPKFAIGQRALLLRTAAGNLLWDCIPLLDESLAAMIRGLGGLSAVAISHPHYYATMIEWSRTFDCPIYLHVADRPWIMRPDPAVVIWEGETQPLDGGLTLIRCGGHFDGGTVLHWPGGAGGQGALLSGDIIQVVPDRRWVGFMYSYPNLLPLPVAAVRHIEQAVEPFAFDRIYGAFWNMTVENDAKAAVRRSAQRYARAIQA